MKPSQAGADILTRDPHASPEEALARVTHLCIAAHQDDIEIMAQSGIDACRGSHSLAFGGVVVTDGAGSPRGGVYSDFNDNAMRERRREEQRSAARLGGYEIMIQLAHPSADLRPPRQAGVLEDLRAVLGCCRPRVLYVHNPADKHDTHVAVLLRCLEVLRSLPQDQRPAQLLGCEVWRSLDWLDDASKIPLPTDADPELARRLLACFDSQISGGKRYDLAVDGRRLANATFHQSHAVDAASRVTWSLDLTPLLRDDTLSLEGLVSEELRKFQADVGARLARLR